MKTISPLSLLAVLLVVLTGAAVAKPGKSVKRMAKPIAGSYAVILADTIRDEPRIHP